MSLRGILGTLQQEDNNSYSNDYYYDPEGYIAGFVLPTFQEAGISDICTDNDSRNRTGCNRKTIQSDVYANEATLLANYALDNGWVIDSITSYDDYKFEGTLNDVSLVMAPVLKYQDT